MVHCMVVVVVMVMVMVVVVVVVVVDTGTLLTPFEGFAAELAAVARLRSSASLLCPLVALN